MKRLTEDRPEDSHGAARASNTRLADDYDAMPYAPQAEPMLDLERVFGLAAIHGAAPIADPEVLDIGCGVGVQLERVAARTGGRLVGSDISPSACATARDRLAAHCARATILQSDVLDLDPAALGTFDVIYAVGIIYVTPPAVRERIFELIGACLKPGGVAVLSYYSGAMGALRPQLNRMVATAVDRAQPPRAQAAQARGFLRNLAGQFSPQDNGLPAQTARMIAAYPDDATLFHETLCEQISVLSTGEVEAALAARGLRFMSYLHPMPYAGLPTSAERARGADLFDFMYGGYRYAAYLKAGTPEAPPSAALAPRWLSGLKRSGPADFHDPALGSVRVADARVQAALETLSRGPAGRAELNADAALDAELHKLWQAGWLTPLGG